VQRLKAVLIVDDGAVTRWQKDALGRCRDLLDVVLVASCRNTAVKRRPLQHLLYYLLNFVSIRPGPNRRTPLDPGKAETIVFDSVYENAWQRLPDQVAHRIDAIRPDVVIKFGMNLLKDPHVLGCRLGVMSFHHGDPAKYRGRPAGFYEILNHEDSMGVIVQKLSNTLDGGAIYAAGHSKIVHHNYRKTLANAYRNSAPLLRKALLNARRGTVVPNPATGRNYRLPSNAMAAAFLLLLAKRKIARLLYGAFIEKRWNISVSKRQALSAELADGGRTETALVRESCPRIPGDYVFYADPFFSPDGETIFAEALSRKTGLGEIVSLAASSLATTGVLLKGQHHSYPQPVEDDGAWYLLPEVAAWSSPLLFALEDGRVVGETQIEGLEDVRLVDATHFCRDDLHYIFAGRSEAAFDNLNLYVGPSLRGPYLEHPMNPIVIDPSCARMAGAIMTIDGRLYRLGQDNSFGYGNGIWICEITALDAESYAEEKRLRVRMESGLSGPHTIDSRDGGLVFDFYEERFAPLAGYRRLLGLLANR